MFREITPNELMQNLMNPNALVLKRMDYEGKITYEVIPLADFGTIHEIMLAAESGSYRFAIDEPETQAQRTMKNAALRF